MAQTISTTLSYILEQKYNKPSNICTEEKSKKLTCPSLKLPYTALFQSVPNCAFKKPQ